MSIFSFSTTFKNTSDKWLLVGNGTEIIAAYETLADAKQGLETEIPSIEDSPYGSVRVLAPGDAWEWNGCQLRPLTAQETAERDAQVDGFFSKFKNP